MKKKTVPRNPAASGGIAGFRNRIDRLNRRLLALLNRRAEIACRIGDIKRAHRLPVSDPLREKAILNALSAQTKGPLDAAGVRAVFSAIIRETKRIERGHIREQNAATGKTHIR
jgi:chorismate mutase / prephenate dehydratase